VPHTVFWVDYLDRELQLGGAYASTQWAFFGLGAMVGPLCAAYCATRWGWWGPRAPMPSRPWPSACRWSGPVSAAMRCRALWWGRCHRAWPITSGYLMQLIGPGQHKKMWGYATAAFALLQASSGYLMAFVYASSGSYRQLFVLGCAALGLGALLVASSRLAAQ
jgi:hypothetical protein